jgi:RND family efflux transporter MFP subunit
LQGGQDLNISNNARLGLALLAMVLLWGCTQKNEYAPPPPPKVTVAQPLVEEVTDYLEFTGTTEAVAQVDVRARAKGLLESMNFAPGTEVQAGDLLFAIDPREYQAELDAAQAELASAEAQLKRAGIELGRAQRLYKKKAGSESDVVKWQGEADVAKAAILRAQAKVEAAQLNLGYTQVTAPIEGRVSRDLVDPGNLVGYGEPTLLATVTDDNPIYAYFNLNERDLLMVMRQYKARHQDGGTDSAEVPIKEARIPVLLGLADEQGYPHEGIIDYVDSSVDPNTGTLQLRGVFANEGRPRELLPGLFTRLRMPIRQRQDALLVSERAVGADQGGPYLLVVDSANLVQKRPIVKGQVIDGLVVIDEGLRPGEWVVVKGVQRARPGAKVDPQRTDMAGLRTSAQRAQGQKEQAAGAETPEGAEPNAGAPAAQP